MKRPKKMTLEAWLDEARRLRREAFRSEGSLYLHLVAGEGRTDIWQGSYTSFEQFLSAHNLADPARYSALRNALAVVSPKEVSIIGVDGAIEAARIGDPKRRDEVVVHLHAKAVDRGFPLSARETRRVVHDADPTPRQPSTIRNMVRDRRLAEENVALRRENARLHKENEKLRTQLAKIEEKKAAS